ncbi:hypothetical protein CKO44_24740 [Rubrivivax gelatinosus]|uniref:esterase/lipase family protein n=1 Tax=Rubrivivax gelatinosus TaxID=28068 RepID=UPI001907E886|nr:alpha/beta fold hydrolase [Rubrivivax gelatinosus]MBK1616652.1 hypothetical protein [Rubrivivax gelatinosus]
MTSTANPFDAYHIAPISYDKDGHPVAEAPFTSTSDTKRYAVIVPPSTVIPVIFVPGIMGSNLKLKRLPAGFEQKRYRTGATAGWEWPPVKVTTEGWGDRAWRPDDSTSFMARRFWPLTAADRRALLDPRNTEVDDRADLPPQALAPFTFDSEADGRDRAARGEQRRLGFVNEMKRRGWGTVMLTSYGPLLAFLEHNLNHMYQRGQLREFWADNIIGRRHVRHRDRGAATRIASDWGVVKGDKPITADDVTKAARYWLPVHAVGYNWTQSNRDSGKYLAGKIAEFIGHYQKLGYECEKAVLITHSMGGLVARAAVHAQMGAAADKVIGVVHGVMPTQGAAVAYRRCRAGFEGSGVKGNAVASILGGNGPEVSAVFSNCPGALQLLPSKRYGTDWLQIKDHTGAVVHSLPKNDPYSEIYSQKDVWWRLMNPEWVLANDDALAADISNAWRDFTLNLDEAQSFHETLANGHHPHTHAQYGADDDDHRAFERVVWQAQQRLVQAPPDYLRSRVLRDGPEGEVFLANAHVQVGRATQPAQFTLSDKKGPGWQGDGTVPLQSASKVDDQAEFVARHAGYDHQDSYKDWRAQELAAYSIVRLIAENAA